MNLANVYKIRIINLLLAGLLLWSNDVLAQAPDFDTAIKPADERLAEYLPLLYGKNIALVVNQTSAVNGRLLPDVLLAHNVNVRRVFVPEHGFRGRDDAGATVSNTIDSATGIPVISLYGKHKKPRPEDLDSVDVVVYDLQDVGVRFYTYISTLQYVMEACAEHGKELMILDKPDPNGFYVDGPVLDKACRSFVGMQPVPVVYGMTPGEYAQMLLGERWFAGAEKLQLTVIPCLHYSHSKYYRLPVAPSPNLKDMSAVYAYPSLCFFEGTVVSVGRGTDHPFQQWGCPAINNAFKHSFVPHSMEGAKKPPYEGLTCYGEMVAPDAQTILATLNNRLDVDWLVEAYRAYPSKDSFFTDFFTKLAGTRQLEAQIKAGLSPQEIRDSWSGPLARFKQIRKKYLLYKDFE
jgi:uncharacterized protein YbbC (DUF1343 family)